MEDTRDVNRERSRAVSQREIQVKIQELDFGDARHVMIQDARALKVKSK